MRKRRYEILLPLTFNDGQPVPDEALYQTREELLARFDSLTVHPRSLLGIWQHEGQRYQDELVRFTIDVEDTEENQFFFTNLKTTLLERFQQVEIYIISYPIDRFDNSSHRSVDGSTMPFSSDRIPLVTGAGAHPCGVVAQEAAQGNRVADYKMVAFDDGGKVVEEAGTADEESGLQTVRKGTDPAVRFPGQG
jgi:hypothetical protein